MTHLSHRAFLKEATLVSHARAEDGWTVAGAFPNRRAYLRWLHVQSGAHHALGARAARLLGLRQLIAAEQTRQRLLSRDLGGEPGQVQGTPPWLTESFAWGVLYALNGSALGASILLKRHADLEQWPTAYLQEMRRFAKSGELLAFFRELDAVPLERVEASAGARAVFDRFSSQVSA